MKITRIAAKSELQKIKAAAYARVSTSYESQEDSFETQCSFFKQLIENDPKLEFVKVYADKGKSGLSADKRTGFQEMMHDARNGKFQLLLCKSISRFARNAIEAQHYVQELMELNIEVRFQKEKISTKDLSAEMTFNILSAAAQEESRSISEKVKWAYRKRAERGVCHLGNNRVLGMDEVDGKLKPNKDAWIIKRIFEEYAAGKSLKEISVELEFDGIKGLRGGALNGSQLSFILRNEIYVGDRKLQKKPPKDYLSKKPDRTKAYNSFYFKNDHEGIVSRDLWNEVQKRLYPPIKGIAFCSVCGEPLHRRKRKNRTIWTCLSDKHKHKTVDEADIIRAVEDAVGYFHPSVVKKVVKRIEFDGKHLEVIM